jgi:hypothetical protein
MFYTSGANRASHRYALTGALAVARLAGWSFVDRPELLSPQFADALYDPGADLVLLAWAEGEAFGVIADGLRDIRGAAVIVMPGRTLRGETTLYMSLARRAQGEVHWHHGLRLWINARDDAWLVPDPDGDEPDGACFRLMRAPLRPAGPPWADLRERGFGLGNADMQLLRLMAQR